MADFYNLADQKLFKDYQFLPQEKYRLGLNLPTDATEDEVVTDQGIVNTNAFANAGGGGDGFSVYNPDPSTIVNQDYDPYAYRNASEMSFVGATDPKYSNQSFDPSGAVADAQQKYNEFQTAPYRMGIDTPVGQRQAQYESDLNETIMDNQERYRTQGQYETVPSELAYSTDTAAQKMMGNYPGYYEDDDEELTGIRSLISKGVNLIPGMGMLTTAAQAIGSLLPINERAIMENELGGQGIMVNDIGQIVQGQGDYNTAQNIMAGYNANMIDADTIQNRIDTINDALGKYDKYDEDSDEFDPGKYQQMIDKLSALDEFAKIQGIAIDRKDIILDYIKKEKKKKDTTTTTGNDEDGSTTGSSITGTGTVSTTSPEYTPVGPNQPDPGPSINQQIDQNNPNNNNDGGAGEGPSNRGRNSSQPGGGFNSMGFSDIRLKENVELIGKSPSNINIYKFNYKDSPTTYQGAMAHEVPWASVQHSNGYMMIDYSKIDVKLKRI